MNAVPTAEEELLLEPESNSTKSRVIRLEEQISELKKIIAALEEENRRLKKETPSFQSSMLGEVLMLRAQLEAKTQSIRRYDSEKKELQYRVADLTKTLRHQLDASTANTVTVSKHRKIKVVQRYKFNS